MYTSQIVKNPSNRVSRWLVTVNSDAKKGSVMILKGRYPSYLFEIVPPSNDPDCISVEYKDENYQVKVLRDFDKAGLPPQSYLIEMIEWYTKNKFRPALKTINALQPA